ncbi:MAG: hydroxyethylthiazole kinase [Clostridia bacterium]|nr:hydroxyethylthiazole kinase [Clostridia bacterium]
MIKEMLTNVREKRPLVHNITNYVTVNDCANALLAIGAAPIMSDEIDDVCDITEICTGLNINIGTLNKNTVKAMLTAGTKAKELFHPVLLDPVGAGASQMRTQTADLIIKEVKPTVIRGNISEIKALAQGKSTTKGVDADIADAVSENNIESVICFAKQFSKETGAVIVITGAIDLIVNETVAYSVTNGHQMMSSITGTGCMLSAIMTAFISANSEDILKACLAAVSMMGVCGERAYKRLTEHDGNATYRNYIIDELYNITPEELEKGAKYEIR